MTGPHDPNDQNGPTGQGPWQPTEPPYFGGPSPLPPPPPRAQLPPSGGTQPTARGRVEISAATALLSAVPWFFWSFVVVSWLAGIVGFGWGWILVALWVLSGAVVFLRSVEDLVARYLFRLRKPTLVEQQRLVPVWQQASVRAGVDTAKYFLWIQESDEVNASPTPGHTVAVTRWALYTLPGSHLEAVIAHELSHHLGGRTWLSLLSFWYSIPARCALIAVRAIVRLMRAVPAVGCAIGGFLLIAYLGILLAVLTFGKSITFPLLFLTPFVAPPILAWLSRREVKQADRRAAVMGYGATLVQVFYGWQMQHQQTLGRGGSRRSQLMSSTPSVVERVQALEGSG
ncbi:M48 family metalloprotease [Kribbella qitaiheensis]|uniref:M48 family metalloprotease n=1 Tax=Kribbella qitaiheensis TaxID=1544730 RepID=A0A7G6X6G8_9ACTN|nr:M48 family metalloprotease [Kribbella qitaiheensis]